MNLSISDQTDAYGRAHVTRLHPQGAAAFQSTQGWNCRRLSKGSSVAYMLRPLVLVGAVSIRSAGRLPTQAVSPPPP
jgi:hypothetical protein